MLGISRVSLDVFMCVIVSNTWVLFHLRIRYISLDENNFWQSQETCLFVPGCVVIYVYLKKCISPSNISENDI